MKTEDDDGSFSEIASLAMQHAVDFRDGQLRPPRPTASLTELKAKFDVGIPQAGRPGTEVVEALAGAAQSGLTGTIQPNFFAWVMGASNAVGVAADWLAAAWGQNAGMYNTSPAAAVAEDVVASWLLELLDLPPTSSVGFTTGATMASFICLVAARNEVLRHAGYNLDKQGIFGAPEIKIYLGSEAHSTIHSGLRYLGFGSDNLVEVPVDAQGRILSASLADQMAARQGPAIVICQAGHINSGDFDPFQDIIATARAHGAWVHVDGAFGLWARAVPSLRSLCNGLELADSWSVDGHKWLQVPYDSGFAIVRDADAHRRAMNISASYLQKPPSGSRAPSQFCTELSRRARGFAAWAVIQHLGREGIEEMVARHCRCASRLGAMLSAEPGINVRNKVVLNQLAISFDSQASATRQDQSTTAVVEQLARQNNHFVEGAQWQGRRIMRVSVTSQNTGFADIDKLGKDIIAAWSAVRLSAG